MNGDRAMYIWQGNRSVLNAILAEILDHVLQEDRPVGNCAVDSNVSAIRAGENDLAKSTIRHFVWSEEMHQRCFPV